MAINTQNVIEKRNVLNEIRCNNMHLQELRLFTIYLSKINARDPDNTRRVRFPISDFLSIMELKEVNITVLKQTVNNLLCKVVNVPTQSGGFAAFQLFKECMVEKEKSTDCWFVEIDAHDRALPLMFEFKRDYFTYELWNALRLSSSNQLRMYELLKQYQIKGERVIGLDELKSLLFIGKDEYQRFGNFKIKVLESCKKALKENTDICFDYELLKKSRGKVYAIKFKIYKNIDHRDQLTLSEFIDIKKDVIDTEEKEKPDNHTLEMNTWQDRLKFFSDALNDEFTLEQVEVLYRLAVPTVAVKKCNYGFDNSMYDYLSLKLSELNAKKSVNHRFNYLKKLIELDNMLF